MALPEPFIDLVYVGMVADPGGCAVDYATGVSLLLLRIIFLIS